MPRYCPRCFESFGGEADRCPVHDVPLVRAGQDDLTGRVLGDRFAIRGCVGRGGMGVVYRAENLLIGREVAIKVLPSHLVGDPASVKRFLSEARAIASLTSENTVVLHDAGITADGVLYYVMELLEGSSLADVLAAEGRLDWARAARIVDGCCASLEEAHGKGLVHRDIKPQNLFLTRRNGEEAVKVLDFGIAKLVGDASQSSVTRPGAVCCTPQYASPEQATSLPLGPSSDLYSLGVVFYEMLAGIHPFDGPSATEYLYQHAAEPAPPISARQPGVHVPAALGAVLHRTLAKDPAGRYQTAAELRRAVRAAAAAAGPSEPHPPPEMAALGVAATAEAPAPPGPVPVWPSPEPAATAPSSIGRRRRGRLLAAALGFSSVAAAAAWLAFGPSRHLPLGDSPPGQPRASPSAPSSAGGAHEPATERPTGPPGQRSVYGDSETTPSRGHAEARPGAPAQGRPRAPAVQTGRAPELPLRTIVIDSEPPEAEVLRDGVSLGQTPREVRLAPTEAPVEIVVRRDGFEDRVVRLGPDDGPRVLLTLKAARSSKAARGPTAPATRSRPPRKPFEIWE